MACALNTSTCAYGATASIILNLQLKNPEQFLNDSIMLTQAFLPSDFSSFLKILICFLPFPVFFLLSEVYSHSSLNSCPLILQNTFNTFIEHLAGFREDALLYVVHLCRLLT